MVLVKWRGDLKATQNVSLFRQSRQALLPTNMPELTAAGFWIWIHIQQQLTWKSVAVDCEKPPVARSPAALCVHDSAAEMGQLARGRPAFDAGAEEASSERFAPLSSCFKHACRTALLISCFESEL